MGKRMTNLLRRLFGRKPKPEVPTVKPPERNGDAERELEEACAAFESAANDLTMSITGPVKFDE